MKEPFIHPHLAGFDGDALALQDTVERQPFALFAAGQYACHAWAIMGLQLYPSFALHRLGYMPRLRGIRVANDRGAAYWAAAVAYSKGKRLLAACMRATETAWRGKNSRRQWAHFVPVSEGI